MRSNIKYLDNTDYGWLVMDIIMYIYTVPSSKHEYCLNHGLLCFLPRVCWVGHLTIQLSVTLHLKVINMNIYIILYSRSKYCKYSYCIAFAEFKNKTNYIQYLYCLYPCCRIVGDNLFMEKIWKYSIHTADNLVSFLITCIYLHLNISSITLCFRPY